MREAAILLTGTGSIGREVLLALLRRTPNRVALIVPDRARIPALQRAAAMFDRLALGRDERARVDVVRGDVMLPGLGLADDVQRRLAESVEAIVHTETPSLLRSDLAMRAAASRSATANALLLAERCFMAGRLKRFVHVSLANDGPAPGRRDNDAERIARAAMHAGLPVTIVRPLNVEFIVDAVAVAVGARCA